MMPRILCLISAPAPFTLSLAGTQPTSFFSKEHLMLRTACALFALVVFVGAGLAADDNVAKQANNKMVKGTVKSVDADTGVLVVNQELKKDGQTQVVDRELSIKATTRFIIMGGGGDGKQEADGKDALKLL